MSANPLLSIEGLTASVDEKTILHNVNLNVAAGETHVLMGPNGAGKSTLGHLVMGDPVYTVNDGRIVFDGQDITELTTDKRSRAGLFLSFQAPVEIPGVPLSSFLRASIAGRPGLEMKGKEFRRRVKELAAELNMDTAYLNRELGVGFSGGEKKKVEMLQLLLLLAYESLWPNAWHFLSIFSGSAWLMTLLWLNFGLMVNRIVQRVIFVTGYYGLTQGLLSVLRLFWGNLINFMANWRALKQVLQHGDPRRVAWDKTTHDFPSVTGDTRSLRPLGQILLENQVITEEQLDTALRNRVEGLRLGGSMLMQGLISAEQLAQALAEQNGVAWESIDAWQIPSSLIAEMPASVALHYAVLPLRLENDELIVGSEDGIDPVSLAALTRKVGRKVRYVIVLRGQIVTGLRHWYARRRGHDPRAMLYNAVQHQWLTEQQAGEIWRQYVPHQFLFAEILTTLGHINRSAINVLLLRHERSSLPLGKFLVTEGVISQETLDRVLTIQRELQVSMQSLLLKAGLNTEQVAQLESENEGE